MRSVAPVFRPLPHDRESGNNNPGGERSDENGRPYPIRGVQALRYPPGANSRDQNEGKGRIDPLEVAPCPKHEPHKPTVPTEIDVRNGWKADISGQLTYGDRSRVIGGTGCMRKILSYLSWELCWVPRPHPPTRLPEDSNRKWVVDFDDAQCVAMRNYGTKDSPFVLAQAACLRRRDATLPGEMRYRSGLCGTARREHLAGRRQAHPDDRVSAAVKRSHNVVVQMNIRRPTFDLVANAKTVRIRAKDQLNASFQLSQVDGVLKVMDQCVADLRQVWNVTAGGTTSPSLKKSAEGTLQGLFRQTTIPAWRWMRISAAV